MNQIYTERNLYNNAERNNEARGGNYQNQIQCYNCQGWGHMRHECSSAHNARPMQLLNSRWGSNSRTSTQYPSKMENQCCPKPIKFITGPQYHNPDAAVRLIGRANEAEVFIDIIKVMALSDTGAQVSTITQDFCEEHVYEIHPVKQMLHLEGTRG